MGAPFLFFLSYLSALIHHFFFCSSWVLILLLPHSFVLIFFYPHLHPLHVFFSPSPLDPLMVYNGPILSFSYFVIVIHLSSLLFTSSFPPFPSLSYPMPLIYVTCAVCRLPRFLQQSAQSGTSSALGVPRTPHRSHL